MIKQVTTKAGKTATKRAPSTPAAKRPAATKVGAKAGPKANTTTAAKRPAGRPSTTRQAASPAKDVKPKKAKLVRDSFTMPDTEYALIGTVKKAGLAAGVEIKKSEILRIGIALVAKLDAKKLKAAQAALLPLKAGRPKKHK